MRPLAESNSAICTAFSAAPFRRLSQVEKKASALRPAGSSRTRPTIALSPPAAANAVG
jgi:hypothetical protein